MGGAFGFLPERVPDATAIECDGLPQYGVNTAFGDARCEMTTEDSCAKSFIGCCFDVVQ